MTTEPNLYKDKLILTKQNVSFCHIFHQYNNWTIWVTLKKKDKLNFMCGNFELVGFLIFLVRRIPFLTSKMTISLTLRNAPIEIDLLFIYTLQGVKARQGVGANAYGKHKKNHLSPLVSIFVRFYGKKFLLQTFDWNG